MIKILKVYKQNQTKILVQIIIKLFNKAAIHNRMTLFKKILKKKIMILMIRIYNTKNKFQEKNVIFKARFITLVLSLIRIYQQ